MLSKFARGFLAATVLFALAGSTAPTMVASKSSAAQIALNPQPLPPHEDGDVDFDFG